MSDAVSTRYREALRRGHLAVVKGNPAEAIKQYQEAGGLAGGRPLPFIAMGNVYLQMRKPRLAVQAFEEALARAPNDLEAIRGKARALEADGQREEAARLMRRGDELEAMAHASQRATKAADELALELERHVREGLRASGAGDLGRAVVAFLAAAEGYAQRNMFDSALDACLRAVEAIPGAIDVHLLMARLYLRRGWTELAVQRVLLLERRLAIDEDPRRRAMLRAMAHDHRDLDPALERIAASV